MLRIDSVLDTEGLVEESSTGVSAAALQLAVSSGAKVIAVLIIRILGKIVPISLALFQLPIMLA